MTLAGRTPRLVSPEPGTEAERSLESEPQTPGEALSNISMVVLKFADKTAWYIATSQLKKIKKHLMLEN